MSSEPRQSWCDPIDLRFVNAVRPALRVLELLHPMRLEGAENIPQGPALLVGNHGLLGYETPLFFEALLRATGRVPRGLADRWFFRVPVLRDALVRLGGVLGDKRNAQALLRRGHLTVCYPGGARETLKYAPEDRYKLRWEQSDGFVRLAMRMGVPLVPFAAAGVDDTYTILSRVRGSGRFLMGHDKYDLPVLLGVGPLPTPVPFWFRIGRPITFDVPPDAADDRRVVRAEHERVWSLAQGMVDELVAEWRAANQKAPAGEAALAHAEVAT